MQTLTTILMVVGVIFLIVGSVWMLVAAFREGPLHGFLMFFFGGIYTLIFTILHWEEAKKPFFTLLIGSALVIGAAVLTPVLAAKRSDSASSYSAQPTAPPSEFRKKMAQAIAAQIASKMKSGSPQTKGTTPVNPVVSPAPPFNSLPSVPVPGSSPVSNAPAPKKSLTALVKKEASTPTAPAKPASPNEWEQARALIRVGGVMQTGNQLLAIVNQKIVKVNDPVSVNLNGRLYHFKVTRIDLPSKTVQFEPIQP